MNNDIKFIDVDVVGEVTGTRYQGTFEIRPFMSTRSKAEYVRLLNREAKGLLREIGPNIEVFRKILEPHLDEEKLDIVSKAAVQTFGVSDPIVDVIAFIAELSILVDKAPDWWKPFDLLDESPYMELKQQLLLIQNPKKEESTPLEVKPAP